MKDTFDLTPDMAKMFAVFEREAKLKADGMGQRLSPPVMDTADAWLDAKADALRAIQGLLAPLAVLAACATQPADILRLREILDQALTSIQNQADKLEAAADKDRDDKFNTCDHCNGQLIAVITTPDGSIFCSDECADEAEKKAEKKRGKSN